MKSKHSGMNPSQVDLVPMIDIVFQLVLFFLVSTTFALLPGISVKLPDSETAQGESVASLVITASDDGRLWLNEQETTLSGLGAALGEFDTGGIPRLEYPVQLQADFLVTNGTIVSIFDALRKNGFSAVNLRTTDGGKIEND